eukprot:m.718067 g.718067  ORF g.718067 m.718067 type:complete len:291 (-) comp22991_c0_seq1:115-987(-)
MGAQYRRIGLQKMHQQYWKPSTPGKWVGRQLPASYWYNPSGRMPISVYPEAFNARSIFNMNLEDDGGLTYLYYNGKYGALPWEFGKGLSYSTFQFTTDLSIRGSLKDRVPQRPSPSTVFSIDAHRLFAATTHSVLSSSTTTHARRASWEPLLAGASKAAHAYEQANDFALVIGTNVTNIGPWDGATVVMVFLTRDAPQPTGPKKKLVAFRKIFLPVDTAATVDVPIVPNFLLTVREDGASCAIPGKYRLHVSFETPDIHAPSSVKTVRTVAMDITGTAPVCGRPLPMSGA